MLDEASQELLEDIRFQCVTSSFAEVMFQKRVFASKNVFLPVDPVITIERGSIAFSMQLGKSYSGI